MARLLGGILERLLLAKRRVRACDAVSDARRVGHWPGGGILGQLPGPKEPGHRAAVHSWSSTSGLTRWNRASTRCCGRERMMARHGAGRARPRSLRRSSRRSWPTRTYWPRVRSANSTITAMRLPWGARGVSGFLRLDRRGRGQGSGGA